MQQRSAQAVILTALFAATMFLSAGLLFSIQPIIAKMLLPLLGGTPAVWTTCMVFFQGMLLAGYGYVHLILNRLGLRAQGAVHAVLLVGVALLLPFEVSEESIRGLIQSANPTWWLLRCLFKTVGLPFFLVSTSAPLLQKWFSRTGHPSAADPYFLYAASNLGSLTALLSYPVLMEPNLRLNAQSQLWTAGYAALALFLSLCLAARWWFDSARRPADTPPEARAPARHSDGAHCLVTRGQRFRWVALAFTPSSLMLGVTTYLSTDIASIPLLWVVPLSLYLLTFVLTFSNRVFVPQRFLVRALPIGAVGLAYLLLAEATEPGWLLILLHLCFFSVAAMVCHGCLASERPAPVHLTEFYFWLALGGVLGGLFNAVAAPNVFNRVVEYPIAIILACLLKPNAKLDIATNRSWVLDFLLPASLGLAAAALARYVPQVSEPELPLRAELVFGAPLILAYAFVDRSVRFGIALAAVLLAGSIGPGGHGRILVVERNFFGVMRVTLDPTGAFRRLVHGNTVHGRQFVDPARQGEPLSYYHRSGPLGQVFTVFESKAAATNVAVVGLGAGSMACYAKPPQRWTFYEINPAILRAAQDTNYFTFLRNCRAAEMRMALGDARLRMREAPAASYHAIFLDAFSSDSIPVHLITREAIDLYLSKLAAGGILVFHISNRSLDLRPVLGDLAASAGLVCYAQDEIEPSRNELAEGKDQSHWAVLARRRQDLGRLVRDSRWLPVAQRTKPQVWTDDFSNIWSVFNWK